MTCNVSPVAMFIFISSLYLYNLPPLSGDDQRLWFAELQVSRVSNCHRRQVKIVIVIVIITLLSTRRPVGLRADDFQ